ncbi:pyridoxamine 5'-phosphate oxidase family protein [Nocardia pseudobrasiliensis]|uniref:Putative pyridoxine 5'-phosphate oxidase superfamily flavin-nucleotide-binding protein n=1 Tax=Nocardia pseudobrasiliensis TaxID=45979 RepID=A0A370HYX2_9NOCA|nr:pyridoxamine 5'-phosphate oxidase family protein [Nocardia pseudobrasiliensis]RDI63520.1 putative pyridoxine 5'-phosphate oxidase superfamily flavin-nucleotide-binding protein [Nocardia pseudobrasiliensis]
MATLYERLEESLQRFITAQPMFFVATAPSDGGRVNLSPKGYRDTFAILDEHTVAYLDLFGSGVETIAHLRDNGRITIMFCSFTRHSKILRLQGVGRVVRPDDPEFAALAPHFGAGHPGVRAMIVVRCERIADSCGFSVPYMDLVDERAVLDTYHGRKSDDDFARRIGGDNATSIDALPALHADHPLPSTLR